MEVAEACEVEVSQIKQWIREDRLEFTEENAERDCCIDHGPDYLQSNIIPSEVNERVEEFCCGIGIIADVFISAFEFYCNTCSACDTWTSL